MKIKLPKNSSTNALDDYSFYSFCYSIFCLFEIFQSVDFSESFYGLGQMKVPFGDAIIATKDTKIGTEICEELWTARQTHIAQALAGVEIFTNSSGSHFNIHKISDRFALEMLVV